ncbi:long chain fatty acid CoA FadD26 [Haloactinospora alba]|uniref:Long chain fatty acid CoA FadD26 n=1 Tax=Haloactinospora alba TaxID=405555 RepID=A0A543NKY4_9ACTN|nr:fatty acyl-AMP ligase [Haloactinospora alba]TQN32480.1 long chain fatty acid CoA FadD26 [Haloactinospora alba]
MATIRNPDPAPHGTDTVERTNEMSVPQPPVGFAETIRHWARTRPQEPASTYLDYRDDPDGAAHTLSYAELDERARTVAAAVREVTAPGERVALLLPQGLDYITAFLGCLYAGVVSVPLYQPEAGKSDERLSAVLADATPAASLTLSADAESLHRIAESGVKTGAVLAVDALDHEPVGGIVPCAAEETAYLQYTSGSTRSPAGVVVTHGNLWSNTRQTRDWLDLRPEETYVSWCPFFHDMGLVVAAATTLLAGAHGVWMSPQAFVQRPIRWLRAISDHGAVATCSPNFGLDLAVRRAPEEQRAALDLTPLRALVVGAEPVREASLTAFAEAYRGTGFSYNDLAPSFGLAEATVAVALDPVGVAPRVRWCERGALAAGRVADADPGAGNAIPVVGCGVPQQQEVTVVDPETGCLAAPDTIGEFWVHGPNVAHGYYARPQESVELFDNRPTDASGSPVPPPADPGLGYPGRGWLRTGDLGFLHEGRMCITSRDKDLIVVRGSNHHPFDLEDTVARALPEMRAGHAAAFQTEPAVGTGLVIVVEVERSRVADLDAERSVEEVRRAVGTVHGVETDDVVLVRPGTIPKTSSGKIRRGACRELYRQGGIAALAVQHSDTGGSSRSATERR